MKVPIHPGYFRGAVFDLDGLLIDSEPFWMEAQVTVLREFGARLTREMQHATTGLRMEEAIHSWRSWFPDLELDGERIRARLLERVAAAINRSGEAKAGARRALEICRQGGCRMAIASSSHPLIIQAAVTRLGFADYFQTIASAESEARGKPHPDVYLSAARILGISPRECIAFEDSLHGVLSAKSAGMHCIAVPEKHNHANPKFAAADRILASLEDFQAQFLEMEGPSPR